MRLVDADVLKAKQQEDADLFIGDDTLIGKSRRDEALNAVANIINAPTVDHVKHGHWTDRAKSILGLPTEACSVCAEWSVGHNKDYCPNCGAKMDEDRDYDHAVEQLEHDMTFEPTYNPEDGSM